MDLCCHHLTKETNLKASCIVATDTGFDSPAGAVALHRNTATPDRFQPAHTCFAAVPPGALPSHSHHHNSLEQQPLGDSSRPSSGLSLTAIVLWHLKQFLQEALQLLSKGGSLSGVSSGCFLRMQKAWSGLSGSFPFFFSSSSP